MLIAGAGGHALELLEVLLANNYQEEIVFFDNINLDNHSRAGCRILQSEAAVAKFFRLKPDFCLGVGKPSIRNQFAINFASLGGRLQSVISKHSFIGKNEVGLGRGLNIMPGSVISTTTSVGDGCLIHIHASLHHNTKVGPYCELSPGSRILGNVVIGSHVSIGSNAVIMPGIVIGDNAVIGAGAVVTKNVLSNITVVGVPAHKL